MTDSVRTREVSRAMFEAEGVLHPSVGCGTANPAGAEFCAGCGHRFASSEVLAAHESITAMANRLAGPEVGFPKRRRKRTDLSLLGCLTRRIVVSLMGVAVLVAFEVAFLVTCQSFNNNEIAWSVLAGTAAAAAAVGLFIWLGSLAQESFRCVWDCVG